MSPERLQCLLNVALNRPEMSVCLRRSLTIQAIAQFQARYPLAGCSVQQDDGTLRVVAVGRN